MRLVVDWTRCTGHGMCAELLPELVTLDEWGYPVVADDEVPPALREYAARARAACPAVAVRLDRARRPGPTTDDPPPRQVRAGRGRLSHP